MLRPSVPGASSPRAPAARALPACALPACAVRAALSIALVVTAVPSPARAQQAPPPPAQPARTGTVVGRVVQAGTGEPIVGALVRVLGGAAASASAPATTTDDDGRFTLRGVPVGIVAVEVRRIGFAPQVQGDLAVSVSKPAEASIAMRPAAAQLATVAVRPSYFAADVRGAPGLVSTQSFSAEEVRRAPGVQEDVVRAVSVLPGVGVTTAGRNDLVVRGGAPFENLFVVDNVEVPNINHFGTQGSTGGPLSLINIDFVQEAALSAGGFGVRDGDRLSSATRITLREGSRERVATELNLSATGFGAIVEGPLGGRGSFLAGARRSYLDLIFNAAGFGFVPAYTDLTVKAVARPAQRDELSFLLIGARGTVTFNDDTPENRFENSRVAAPDQDQYFSGLTWRRSLARGVVTTTLGRTWTRFRTVQRDSSNPPVAIFRANTTEGENSLRTDATWQLRDGVTIDAGVIGKLASDLAFDVLLPGTARRDAQGRPLPLAVDTSFTAWRAAVYAQATLPVGARLTATLGLRGDHYAFLDGATRVSPRATFAWQLDDASRLTLSGGRYVQAVPFIWLVGDPRNRALRPFRADQAVLGWQRLARPDLKVQVETYAKRYADYAARVLRPQAVLQPAGFDDVTTDIPFGLEPLASAGTGTVVGVEGLVQKKLSEIPVYGLASVSVNRTRFRGLDGRAFLGAFDAPLIVNALLGWRPNVRWELSGRGRAASGLPTTPFLTSGPLAGTLDFTRYNEGARLPTFFALDVRVDRRWTLGRTQLITYLDVQNATGRQNVSALRWNARLGAVDRNTALGVLPSIGVNWEF